jgi:hypothetical protein
MEAAAGDKMPKARQLLPGRARHPRRAAALSFPAICPPAKPVTSVCRDRNRIDDAF